MDTLFDLERAFQGCVLHGQPDMRGQVVGDARASADERIQVYVAAYRLRLLEVLQDNFTGLHALLGDEQFDSMGRAYLDAFPSTHPSVRRFGQHLEDFLRATAPYGEHPYLAEMAAFEWAQGLVFDAADEPQAGLDAVAALAPDAWAGLRFGLHAAVRQIAVRWNIPQTWQALEAGEPPDLRLGDTPAHWLLWRADLMSHWRSLGDDESWALQAVRDGQTFGEVCAGLCRWHAPQAAALQAASLLKRWLTDGLIKAVQVG